MAISEAQRFEMHLGLRNTLGDVVANSLMEHLPPSGWSDVARTADLNRLEIEMREGFKSIRNTIRVLVASSITVSVGLIVMLIQLNQSISALK
ncbi:MAG: hypothetical protein KJS66_05135 [Acidobacteria bacterium]|nr:hypothetical protein [Acidobacteriota bacterium]